MYWLWDNNINLLELLPNSPKSKLMLFWMQSSASSSMNVHTSNMTDNTHSGLQAKSSKIMLMSQKPTVLNVHSRLEFILMLRSDCRGIVLVGVYILNHRQHTNSLSASQTIIIDSLSVQLQRWKTLCKRTHLHTQHTPLCILSICPCYTSICNPCIHHTHSVSWKTPISRVITPFSEGLYGPIGSIKGMKLSLLWWVSAAVLIRHCYPDYHHVKKTEFFFPLSFFFVQFLGESVHWTDVCGLPQSMEKKWSQKILIGHSCIAGQMN